MTEPIRIFVDERPLNAAPGSSVLQAVAGDAAELAAALREGRAYVTDGVGRPIEPSATVFPGAIYRVVHSARRQGS
jgi:hypothetical protein